MKKDVVDALSGRFPGRVPTKETLNHPGILRQVSGVDPWDDPVTAFSETWRRLSIDVHVAPPGPAEAPCAYPEPGGTARRPKAPGGTWVEEGWRFADIGVMPTSVRIEYLPRLDRSAEDWVFAYDPAEDDFHLAEETALLRRQNAAFRDFYGELAVHYASYYTTLFMWPVVKFDWEPFLCAAALDPERFDERFWQPWAEISRKHVEALAAIDEEVVFTHDDLSMTTGPVFSPRFYERYIFPRYERIWEPLIDAGKRLVFISDGNIEPFLERLLEFPIAAIMFENPATPFERVLATWGRAGRGFIGGISTQVLTNGTPEEVAEHTRGVIERGREHPGFVLSSCGGLHGNIPMANIRAYFETRNRMGIPAEL